MQGHGFRGRGLLQIQLEERASSQHRDTAVQQSGESRGGATERLGRLDRSRVEVRGSRGISGVEQLEPRLARKQVAMTACGDAVVARLQPKPQVYAVSGWELLRRRLEKLFVCSLGLGITTGEQHATRRKEERSMVGALGRDLSAILGCSSDERGIAAGARPDAPDPGSLRLGVAARKQHVPVTEQGGGMPWGNGGAQIGNRRDQNAGCIRQATDIDAL